MNEEEDKRSNPLFTENWSTENDKVKGEFKIIKTNTNLTSLATIALECLRTTEFEVTWSPRIQRPDADYNDHREYRITDSSTGGNEFTGKIITMDMPQKVTFDTIIIIKEKHIYIQNLTS